MSMALSETRLNELFAHAKEQRILVIGDAMLDVYLIGDVERISPEAPVPVVRVRERRHALGGAANVAQNIMSVGARCDLLAAVGSDAGGEMLRGMLRAMNVGTDSLISAARCTTQKTRVV